MANPGSSRRKAREFAFRVLFEAEQGKQGVNYAWQNAKIALTERKADIERREDEDALDAEGLAFAHKLVLGYDDKRHEIDQTLERVIEGWSFNQMSQTDLTLLRLSTFEIMHTDTPANAVIEVTIRLAKKYGGEESGRFVNGVLARLMKHLETR
ncbi:MAG: transcription antitermination factor NusB [Pleurocapsa sp. SU_196_0]|nr:transcription antitermination factor NusB [Pleurocapsa sp. SU_196_0]